MEQQVDDAALTILIVDDEAINIKLLRAHLQKRGYVVVEADNGHDALELARQKPDLILLDIMMPEMDGLETCRRLKSDEATRNIPVIFLSALSDTDVKTRGFDAGGVDYISKPFDARELLARVRTHLTIKTQERQIRRYADNLEVMVDERTRQLSEAEAELKRDFDIQSVLNALLGFSLDEISLPEITQRSLERLLSVPWLSFQDKGVIYLLDAANGEVSVSARHNVGDDDLSSLGLSQAQSDALKNIDQTCLFQCHDERLVTSDDSVRSRHVCMPIRHGDTVLGGISLFLREERQPDAKERGFVGAVANTLARVVLYKQADAQLRHHAFHDLLSGLPNRTFLLDAISGELARASQVPETLFAVMLLDLDRFNMVNESLGHNVGDMLLVALAERLRSSLGPRGLVCRLGGDEFAVLVSGAPDVKAVTALARQALATTKEPFLLDGHVLASTLSIGIALSSIGYHKAEDLIRDADAALHRAKLMGKARFVVFDQDMHLKAKSLLELVTDLRLAMERQEFFLHYQPIISLRNGETVGVEALLRWQHPTRGLVGPVQFIPVCEETGLIIPIGQWVLEEACKKIQELFNDLDINPCLMLSVNLSGKQFAQEDIFEQVRDVLDRTGFEPGCLKLEITESAVMEDAQAAIEVLKRLKSLNIHVSIDDFGTGYSSLAYLHRFPVDMLKIDRSFVSSMSRGGENLEIVRTIVTLAHTLSMTIIAEGVETAEQAKTLRALGCEYAQGFYYSKPVDEKTLRESDLLTRRW